jgi:hypothetical protein
MLLVTTSGMPLDIATAVDAYLRLQEKKARQQAAT